MVARPVPTSSVDSYNHDRSKDTRQGMAGLMTAAPEPKSALAKYKILASRAAVRVSPLSLGGLSLGDQWSGWLNGGEGWTRDRDFELLDYYYKAGGNFIDIANNYNDEQSELILGEWMQERDIRDEMVVATKYSIFAMDRWDGKYDGIRANHFGNHKKNLYSSVERSLQKLKTTYIDILFVHFWDYSTSIPELMQSLNDLVRERKVLYLGASNLPAWVVAKANEYAIAHGLTEFSVYQGSWNVGQRDVEREIIPMCDSYGMAFMAYNLLGGGMFKTPQQLKANANLRAGSAPSDADIALATVLEQVAEDVGRAGNLTGVALAWARQKYSRTIPIVGGAKTSYLDGNIAALDVTLSEVQMAKLDNARQFDVGFPNNHNGPNPKDLPGGIPGAENFIIRHVAIVETDAKSGPGIPDP